MEVGGCETYEDHLVQRFSGKVRDWVEVSTLVDNHVASEICLCVEHVMVGPKKKLGPTDLDQITHFPRSPSELEQSQN